MSDNLISLPVMETVKSAWGKVKGSKGTFWSVIGCIILVQIAATILRCIAFAPDGTLKVGAGLALLLGIGMFCLYILVIFLFWGMMYIAIQRAMDMPISFELVKKVFSIGLFFRMIGTSILSMIVMLPVAVIFIVPTLLLGDSSIGKLFTAVCDIIGLVLALFLVARLVLAKWLVIGKDLGPVAAIKESFCATRSNVLSILGVLIISILIYMISIIPLGIGLIWSLPYLLLVQAEIYKRLVMSK